jgi:hypothetical protein
MTTDQFLADLDVSDDSSNMSITIEAESRNPEEARLMAQTLADLFVQERDQWNQEQDKSDRIDVTVSLDGDLNPFFSRASISSSTGIFGFLMTIILRVRRMEVSQGVASRIFRACVAVALQFTET